MHLRTHTPVIWLPDRQPEARPGTAHRWGLALILLIAAALRLVLINQPYIDAFSWRQASTAMMADNFYRRDWNIFFPQVSWTGPPPSYQGREFQTVSYLAALLYTLVGQQDWVGRSIAVGFGVWGVFALYQLMRRLWDEAHALLAALLLGILPGAVFIDRSFLPDGPMLALVTTGLWLFVEYLQTSRTRFLVMGAAVMALAWLTKLPSIVTLGALVYATRVIAPAKARSVAVAVAVALLPVAGYYAWAVHLGRSYPPYHVAGASNWLWKDDLAWWWSQRWFLRESLGRLNLWLWTAPIIFFTLMGLVTGPPKREGETNSAAWFFHCWLGGFAILYLIGARELKENPWNFHILSPLAAVMSARALMVAAGAGSVRPGFVLVKLVALLAIVPFYALPAMRSMYRPHAYDTYQMGLMLRELAGPDELVVTVADDVGDPIGIYYARRHGWVFPPAHLPELWRPWNVFPPDDKVSIAMLEDLRSRGARWLGIVNNPREDGQRGSFWTNHQQLVTHIDHTCELITKTPSYVIYRIPSNPTTTPAQ